MLPSLICIAYPLSNNKAVHWVNQINPGRSLRFISCFDNFLSIETLEDVALVGLGLLETWSRQAVEISA